MSDNIINADAVTCAHCGNSFDAENLTETSAGLVCQECLDSDFYQCDDCGNYYPNDEKIVAANGEDICQSCQEEDYYTCEECGEVYRQDDITYIESTEQYLCDYCRDSNFTKCDSCGNWIPDRERICTAHGNFICQECYGECYFTCDDCGVIYHLDNGYSTDDGIYCSGCYPDHEEQDNDNLHNYGYKPSLNFHKTSDDPQAGNLYFGIELEQSHADCDDRDNNVDTCLETLNEHSENSVYLKEDSSLKCGFEIVSHPRTLNSWHDFFPKVEEYFSQAQKYNDGKNNGASDGLHIHISRKGMSTPHIIRFGAFIAACQDEITILARRTSDQWAKHYKKPETAHDCRVTAQQSSRYVAVNWCNSSTVELRMFRSTLDAVEFYAAIEFAHAAYQFTKNCININQIINNNPWPAFMNYVKNNERYSSLVKFFARVERSTGNA